MAFLSTATHPPGVQVTLVLMFAASAVAVASVSRQKTLEVRRANEEGARRLQALFERSIDAILFFDSSGRYVDANPAATALLGITREEIITSRRIGDFSPEADRARLAEMPEKLVRKGHLSGDWTIKRMDGTLLETQYSLIANVTPRVHCFISHDVSARKQAEELSRRLLQLQDEERKRIARDLHDTTTQNLTAAKLNLVRISREQPAMPAALKEAVTETVSLVDQSLAEIRTLSYALYPPMLDEMGVLAGLRWFVRGFAQRSGVETSLDAPEELGHLPRDVELAVFRIVQEALTNVQRHSGSKVAKILMQREPQRFTLVVEDEGRGMPGELINEPGAAARAGIGLASIQERVRELGGGLQIESGSGGTRVIVTIPLTGVES